MILSECSPAEAYWNQRSVIHGSRERILALSEAVGRPTDLHPYQWAQIMAFTLEFRPEIILELGRGYGNSTCAFTEAANLLRPHRCLVISICMSDDLNRISEKVARIVPEEWFIPLRIVTGDILAFDFHTALADFHRILVFWDAHGYDIAECVLGSLCPMIADRSHIVIMHDIQDARYLDDSTARYGSHGLWKGNSWDGPMLRLGTVHSSVEQAVSIVDFTGRNGLTLFSADHGIHKYFVDVSRLAEMKRALGDTLFSLQAHWRWFSLNEKTGPFTYPHFPPVKKGKFSGEKKAKVASDTSSLQHESFFKRWLFTNEITGAFSLTDYRIHNTATITKTAPLTVLTPKEQWSYAVSFPLNKKGMKRFSEMKNPILICVETEILSGEIGISCAREDHSSFIVEVIRPVSDGKTTFDLLIDSPAECRWLIVRNTADTGLPSQIAIHSITVFSMKKTFLPSFLRIKLRDYMAEALPQAGGVETFDQKDAKAINKARLEHLESLYLPVNNKRVLDVGCGVGHFSQFYRARGCSVVGIDARKENIDRMLRLYPDVEGHVIDVQVDSLKTLGGFDIVHCYGLLYHLENPIGALRNMYSVCKELLIIETMICDSSKPVVVLTDETKSFSQALHGIGCRPSPGFIAMVLNRIGFRHVYDVVTAPDHEDFQFEWKDTMEIIRDGHNLRCIFIASHDPVRNKNLFDLI